jgi:hypothetical protein
MGWRTSQNELDIYRLSRIKHVLSRTADEAYLVATMVQLSPRSGRAFVPISMPQAIGALCGVHHGAFL